MSKIEVRVPDIGDFHDVPVIEILVKPGDTVALEDSLITLESDKATLDIPSPAKGRVDEIALKVGDKVSEGALILALTDGAAGEVGPSEPEAENSGTESRPRKNARESPGSAMQSPPSAKGSEGLATKADIHAEVLVLGAGPGGYTAAFRAADLGKKVVLIERHAALGGVCLNVGCIPSKALLHVAKVIAEAREMSACGVKFDAPQIDLAELRGWKNDVVARLTKGLAGLAQRRDVRVVRGNARFASPNRLRVETGDGEKTVSFDHAVIAAGSEVATLPGLPYTDRRLMDSTRALDLDEIPQRLLVIGGGIIGLEMACFYHALGSRISVAELTDGLLPGVDRELVKPLHKHIGKRYENIWLNTRVTGVEAHKDGLRVTFEGEGAPAAQAFDRVLLAIGRRPSGKLVDAENAGVEVDERGFIRVDRAMRTNVAHIHAIGDIVGEPMLAHKATHEGKLAAEIICGHKTAFDARAIPSVAYTDPEIAWMGLTEEDAGKQNVDVDIAVFPWAASGRALTQNRAEGLTRLLFDRQSRKLLGAGIVGPNAGELIAETVLALELGADADDLALTIHPHPTLSETVFFAAELAAGSITDMMPRSAVRSSRRE